MSFNKVVLLDLRGTFLLPELSGQGLLHWLGNGPVAYAVPIDEEHILIRIYTSVIPLPFYALCKGCV